MRSFGFARLISTPLLSASNQDRLVELGHATSLGTANLVGYLLGSLLATQPVARVWKAALMRSLLPLTAKALLACVYQVSAASPSTFPTPT